MWLLRMHGKQLCQDVSGNGSWIQGHPPNAGVAGFASERADVFAAAFASNTCFALRAAM